MANENSIHLGNQAFLDEDYSGALQAYDAAISAGGEDEAIARSNRAATYLKVCKHREALQDASVAVRLKPTEIAFYRKGLASFALEEFETAREAFRQGQQSMAPAATDSDPRKYRTWIRKCEAEMEAEEHADLSVGTPVSAKHKDAPTSANVAAPATPGDAATPATGRARAPVSSAPTHLRIKFQYYQSYEKITVAVLEKGLQEAEVNVEVGERRLTVRRKGDGALLFDKVLYEEVLPNERKTRFMSSKLEITLTKKSPADWPELEAKGGTVAAAVAPTPQPTAADTAKTSDPSDASAAAAEAEPPTKLARPYSSSKDWDVVEKEVQKELDADKPEGEEALNHLFKQIYGNADEDTRRAMVKSFQTSGGTVLSTNWDEVGKADYEKERQAPKGMEWRTWEGQKLPQKEDDDN